jgi:hypothetical protein
LQLNHEGGRPDEQHQRNDGLNLGSGGLHVDAEGQLLILWFNP